MIEMTIFMNWGSFMTIQVKCIHCGHMAHEFTATCPKCGKPTANKWAPTEVSSPPWNWSRQRRGINPVYPIAAIVIVLALGGILAFVLLK